jgi:hypothetical protein
MHHWSLGVLLLIIAGLSRLMQIAWANLEIAISVHMRLGFWMSGLLQCEGFRLPTYRKYFSDPSNITVNEHMAVQQVGAVC